MSTRDAVLTDAQVRALGYEPTAHGWIPTRGQSGPDLPSMLSDIADAPPSPPIPEALREINGLAAAARRVTEEETLTFFEMAAAIRALLRTATNAQLSEWAKDAILREWYDYAAPERPQVPQLEAERDLRRLTNAGWSACPICHAGLPSPIEFDRWRNRRRWAAEATEVRERRGA